MEKSNVIKMKTIAVGSLYQQPTFDIIDPLPPYISFPHSTTIRNASFSSYLKPEEPNNQVDEPEISIFDAQKYFNETGSVDPKLSKRVSPLHASIINLEHIAQRCDLSSVPRFCSASSSVDGYGRNYRARSFHATPTSSSEASWNSQTGLLSNPPGAIAVTMQNPTPSDDKKRGSAMKWLFRKKCPCAGKKSIQVEEKPSEPRTPPCLNHNSDVSLNAKKQIPDSVESTGIKSSGTSEWLKRQDVVPNSHRISAENSLFPIGLSHHRALAFASSGRPLGDGTGGFTFPILSQTSTPMKLVLNGLPSTNYNKPTLEDPPRDSLEVFRPSDDAITTKSTTELHRQNFIFPASPKSRMTVTDDDIASDASSDLFEIESFSTQTTSYPMYNNRQDSLDEALSFNARRLIAPNGGSLYCRGSLDEPMAPSMAPAECYEPSEASIDWSVTTAEGFDRASVANFSVTASEADDTTITRHHELDQNSSAGGGCGNGKRKGGNGGLLSCRCEKAVSIGPHPVKCVPNEGQRVPNSTLRHVGSRPPIANKPPLARSHSARLSLPFTA